jgi:transposase
MGLAFPWPWSSTEPIATMCALLCATLDGIVIARSEPTEERPQHLCLDAGYDGAPAYQEVETRHYVPHIRSRGEEKQEKVLTPGYRARRWVVERTHSWINRSRRLLVRSREKRGALPRFPSPCLCSIDLCQNPGFRISSKYHHQEFPREYKIIVLA